MKNTVIIYKIFIFFTVLLTLLPYLKTTSLSTDIQLHSIVMIFIFFFLYIVSLYNKYIFEKSIILFFSIFILSLDLLLILNAEILDYFRILFFIISFLIFFKIYQYSYSVIYYAVTISTMLYLIGVILQLLLGMPILEIFVSNLRFSSARGLTSFTSEPSFFGLVSLTHILILELIQKNNFRFFQFIGLICVLLSGSMFVILPTLIILFLYILQLKNAWKFLLIVGFIGFILILSMISLYPEMRAVKLFNLLLDNPILLLDDVSMKNRLLRSLGPLYLSYENSFMPQTFFNISNTLSELVNSIDNNEHLRLDRLSNIFTYLIYPFGYFAILFISYFFYILHRLKVPLFLIFTILYFSMGTITIVTPYVTMLVAFIFAKYYKNRAEIVKQ